MKRSLEDVLYDLKNAIAVADIELAEQLVNEALDTLG
jgi:hypothetical protein